MNTLMCMKNMLRKTIRLKLDFTFINLCVWRIPYIFDECKITAHYSINAWDSHIVCTVIGLQYFDNYQILCSLHQITVLQILDQGLVLFLGLAASIDECTFGESYWCSSFETAKTCGAIGHCKSTIWKKEILKLVRYWFS